MKVDAILGCSRACSSCDGAADCKCKCHARNKRMRKERPTMAFFTKQLGVNGFADGSQTLAPLGLCPNVPKNCGHCWYCKERAK